VIYFISGLAFFVMGFASALAARIFRDSRLVLTRSLPWLAAFGLMVGLAEWGTACLLLAPLAAAGPVIGLARALLLLTGHACLLGFGLRLVRTWESPVPILALALTVGAVALALTVPVREAGWPLMAHAAAAFLLGLPGAALAARGLLEQRRDLAAYFPRSARDLTIAAWAFILSVPIGPLAVPPARRLWGVPVQVPLTVGGLILAWSLFAALEALRLEQARRLERAERREVALEERYRLTKELNDGVIQDLFAAGMLIGAARFDLPTEQRPALKTAEEQLRGVVERLRAYLTDDALPEEANLPAAIRDLVDEFHASALIPVKVNLDESVRPDAATGRAIRIVLAEALSNVRRHAQATLVTVALQGDQLSVTDNGRGMTPGQPWGPGVERMYRAAEAAGVRLDVGPGPGRGTRVRLWLHGNTKGLPGT